jgi:hypothetical protein
MPDLGESSLIPDFQLPKKNLPKPRKSSELDAILAQQCDIVGPPNVQKKIKRKKSSS